MKGRTLAAQRTKIDRPSNAQRMKHQKPLMRKVCTFPFLHLPPDIRRHVLQYCPIYASSLEEYLSLICHRHPRLGDVGGWWYTGKLRHPNTKGGQQDRADRLAVYEWEFTLACVRFDIFGRALADAGWHQASWANNTRRLLHTEAGVDITRLYGQYVRPITTRRTKTHLAEIALMLEKNYSSYVIVSRFGRASCLRGLSENLTAEDQEKTSFAYFIEDCETSRRGIRRRGEANGHLFSRRGGVRFYHDPLSFRFEIVPNVRRVAKSAKQKTKYSAITKRMVWDVCAGDTRVNMVDLVHELESAVVPYDDTSQYCDPDIANRLSSFRHVGIQPSIVPFTLKLPLEHLRFDLFVESPCCSRVLTSRTFRLHRGMFSPMVRTMRQRDVEVIFESIQDMYYI